MSNNKQTKNHRDRMLTQQKIEQKVKQQKVELELEGY